MIVDKKPTSVIIALPHPEMVIVCRGLLCAGIVIQHFLSPRLNNRTGTPFESMFSVVIQFGPASEGFLFIAGLFAARSLTQITTFSDRWIYLGRRFIRVCIPYWVVVVSLCGILPWLRYEMGYSDALPAFVHYFSHFFFLTDLIGLAWLDIGFWFLAWLMRCYLVLCIMDVLLSRVTDRRPTAWACVMGCVGAWIAAAVGYLQHDTTVIRCVSFAVGAAFYWSRTGVLNKRVGWVLILALAAQAVLPWGRLRELGVAFLVVALYATWSPSRFTSIGWLVPIRWLGSRSFSVYLVHAQVGFRILNYCHQNSSIASTIAWMLLASFVTLIVTEVFYHWIERPCVEWSQAIWRKGDASIATEQ